MSVALSRDDRLLVEAYCDGELDAAAALALERRMAGEPHLKGHYDRVMALRSAIQRAPRERMNEQARASILAAALGEEPAKASVVALPHRPGTSRRFDLSQLAAAMVAAAVIASAGTAYVTGGRTPPSDVAAIIAGHQRALLAASAFDIASSDRHTVKPWFNAKLAISPFVPELAEAGFPLVGGRVEVVGGKAVPTMVYLRRGHLISVVAIPTPGAAERQGTEETVSRDGFVAESWSGQGFVYTAVSDLGREELDAFCEAWRNEAKSKSKS